MEHDETFLDRFNRTRDVYPGLSGPIPPAYITDRPADLGLGRFGVSLFDADDRPAPLSDDLVAVSYLMQAPAECTKAFRLIVYAVHRDTQVHVAWPEGHRALVHGLAANDVEVVYARPGDEDPDR